jgi:5-methylcytosine-specific restriction endonuclease McrA
LFISPDRHPLSITYFPKFARGPVEKIGQRGASWSRGRIDVKSLLRILAPPGTIQAGTIQERGGQSFMPRYSRPRPAPGKSQEELDELVRRMKAGKTGESAHDTYRERSLKLHGLVCAKCGRDFDQENLHLLTVHHRDGNHFNNPLDGSNWENLCIWCHDDEHSRSLLGNFLQGDDRNR